jgi:hypothetical protein
MSTRQRYWTWSAISFVIVAALLGAVIDHYAHRVLRRVDERMGYSPNPEGVREFLRELKEPTFAQAGAESMRNAIGRDVFLYRAVEQVNHKVYGRPWEPLDQGDIGSCVGNAFALGVTTAQSVDHVTGKLPRPPPACSVEPIYGGARTRAMLPPQSRGPAFDGTYGGAAARWITGRCKDTTVGGVLHREVFGTFDLRQYSVSRCRQWGDRGVPDELAKLAAGTRMKCVQVSTWAELCASLERGSPVAICSQVGFEPKWGATRDADGFKSRAGKWGHAMLAWGVRHRENGSPRDGALIANSWGSRWISGPRWPDDQPDGTFWADRAAVEDMLRAGDSWAIGSDLDWRDLQNANWGLAL